MTLTLEIPEDLAPTLAALPESQRQTYVLALLRTAEKRTARREQKAELPGGSNLRPSSTKFEPSQEPALTPELIERLRVSFAQSDAGDVIDGDVFMAELFEGSGLPTPEPFNQQAKVKKAA